MSAPEDHTDGHDHILRIRRGGCDIEGRWRLEGDEVRVHCRYGDDRTPLARGRPDKVAETLLARLAFAGMGCEREARSGDWTD